MAHGAAGPIICLNLPQSPIQKWQPSMLANKWVHTICHNSPHVLRDQAGRLNGDIMGTLYPFTFLRVALILAVPHWSLLLIYRLGQSQQIQELPPGLSSLWLLLHSPGNQREGTASYQVFPHQLCTQRPEKSHIGHTARQTLSQDTVTSLRTLTGGPREWVCALY